MKLFSIELVSLTNTETDRETEKGRGLIHIFGDAVVAASEEKEKKISGRLGLHIFNMLVLQHPKKKKKRFRGD